MGPLRSLRTLESPGTGQIDAMGSNFRKDQDPPKLRLRQCGKSRVEFAPHSSSTEPPCLEQIIEDRRWALQAAADLGTSTRVPDDEKGWHIFTYKRRCYPRALAGHSVSFFLPTVNNRDTITQTPCFTFICSSMPITGCDPGRPMVLAGFDVPQP
ncbi:hypothetical protein NDU88_001858 [Pleurodeles waltl]|uniref:Uncharacterized protein n=1 Tax=Pleurodeles waltl TaxID=8319 RepID=A0AAV7QB22_PLEWA|nr:hypothetical protein NDU88_001858 [Pleurodeles waltl]